MSSLAALEPSRRKPQTVLWTIIQVLRSAEGPMDARDIHAIAAEVFLRASVSRSLLMNGLSMRSRGQHPPLYASASRLAGASRRGASTCGVFDEIVAIITAVGSFASAIAVVVGVSQLHANQRAGAPTLSGNGGRLHESRHSARVPRGRVPPREGRREGATGGSMDADELVSLVAVRLRPGRRAAGNSTRIGVRLDAR